MLSNITIGQYYPAKSLLHRMDPRMKVILTAVFIVLIFLANNFASMALVLAFLGITVALSRVPLKMILRGLKAIVIIVVFTSVLNLFYVQGGKILVDFWIVHITTKERIAASLCSCVCLLQFLTFSNQIGRAHV